MIDTIWGNCKGVQLHIHIISCTQEGGGVHDLCINISGYIHLQALHVSKLAYMHISGQVKLLSAYLVNRESLGMLHLLDGGEFGKEGSSFGGGIVHLAILQQQRGNVNNYGSLENCIRKLLLCYEEWISTCVNKEESQLCFFFRGER